MSVEFFPRHFVLCLTGWLALNSEVKATCTGLGCKCTISVNPISFGAYSPFDKAPLDTTNTISATCSALQIGAKIAYTITTNMGNGGSFSPRVMSSSSNTLNYNLYTDSRRSSVWGNGNSGTSVISDSYSLLSSFSQTKIYSIYGRIFANQNVFSGNYTDAIVVTINF